MNTTPTTSKNHKVSYTVVTGRRKSRIPKQHSLLTILLLNRIGKFNREEFLTEYQDLDFAEILSIEGTESAYDIESRARKFPEVRFLLLEEDVSVGAQINLGFEEVRSKHVLVVWTDMKISRSTLNPKAFERLERQGNLCTVPLIKDVKAELVPTIQMPAFVGRKLKVVPWATVEDGMPSIFPFDYCGIYDKSRFILIGGYDQRIFNPYWQKMDFGFRTFMWGQRIVCDTSFELSYSGEVISEDNTPDASYKIFYLKSIAIKQSQIEDRPIGVLPFYRYFVYMLHSDTGPIYSLKEFLAVREWVRENRERFVLDSRSLVSGWEIPE
jgi:hypothetical protein